MNVLKSIFSNTIESGFMYFLYLRHGKRETFYDPIFIFHVNKAGKHSNDKQGSIYKNCNIRYLGRGFVLLGRCHPVKRQYNFSNSMYDV